MFYYIFINIDTTASANVPIKCPIASASNVANIQTIKYIKNRHISKGCDEMKYDVVQNIVENSSCN